MFSVSRYLLTSEIIKQSEQREFLKYFRMKFLASVIVLLSWSSCMVFCVVYTDCGSEVGKFTKITVTNCDETKPRCILKRGTNATVAIEFTLNSDNEEKEVKAVCHGKVSGLDVPFRLPNPNACVDSNIECPLKKDIAYVYDASFPVLKIYPKVDVEVKYELKNSEGKDIICVLIPVKIQ